MVDVLKITSPVEVKSKIQNAPRRQHTDAIFDLTNPAVIPKDASRNKKVEEDSSKQALLRNLNREIYRPLLNHTKAQSDSIRKLVLYAKLFEISSGIITEDFLKDFFIRPEELLTELLAKEEAATVYKGDFFETLRTLVKNQEHAKLQGALLSVLKHFDCYVNRGYSLQSILARSHSLLGLLAKEDNQTLAEQIEKLEVLFGAGKENYEDIIKFLKNEFVPALRGIVANYLPADKVYDHVISIIHYIVRYDKADLKMLEDAFLQFGEELKSLYAHLPDEELSDMKEALLQRAGEAREEAERFRAGKGLEDKWAYTKGESDIAALLSKALDKSSPARISSAAQDLLSYMLQSESPVLPLIHFMIPLRFLDENTYGEFFIDKDCHERKGDAAQATNIFFTIQSDLYGTFEVDLLAKDRSIELDIKCPQALIAPVKETKSNLKDLIEVRGYRLMSYQVGEYTESQAIFKRFPELAGRKAGIDVKI